MYILAMENGDRRIPPSNTLPYDIRILYRTWVEAGSDLCRTAFAASLGKGQWKIGGGGFRY